MKNIKYLWLCAIALGLTACNDESDFEDMLDNPEPTAELEVATAGSANFSTFVSVGNSLTAGYADGALYKIGQENSMPSIMAEQFAKVGGGAFTQPLMEDNIGGLLAGGSPLLNPMTGANMFPPRFYLDLSGANPTPVRLNANSTTDIVTNNPTGPFNNMGVPGAKSYHLLAPGYGNLGNVSLGLANPYFVRMTGTTPNASVLELTMAQAPTFFSLWIGNNDVLGYALSGGDGSDPITPVAGPPGVGFDQSYGFLIASLTSNGAKGVVANIPDVTSIPHFTTVPYNPLEPSNPDFGPQIPLLNTIFGALNQIYDAIGQPERSVVFSDTEANAVVIKDEKLADISATITGALNANPDFPAFIAQFGLPPAAAPLVANLLGTSYGQTRQANASDLFVLSSSSIIGTVNGNSVTALMGQGLSLQLAGQFSIEGVTFPLADKWVLLPSEQAEIKTATDLFNSTIKAQADAAGLAFVDANSLLNQLAASNLPSGDYVLNSNLVTGGAFSLDGVHPTSRGYALLANQFLKAIDVTYGSNFEASGNLVDIGLYNTNYSQLLLE